MNKILEEFNIFLQSYAEKFIGKETLKEYDNKVKYYEDKLIQIECEYSNQLKNLKNAIKNDIDKTKDELIKYKLETTKKLIEEKLKEIFDSKGFIMSVINNCVAFSNNERKTFFLLIEDYSVNEIAKIMEKSTKDIRNYLDRILVKILDHKELSKFIFKKIPDIEEKESLKTLKKIFNIELNENNEEDLTFLIDISYLNSIKNSSRLLLKTLKKFF